MLDATPHIDLEIIYQDEHYVAINKPAGVLVHRSKIDPRASKIALQMLRDQVGQHVYPVHRLDKPTSGVLLFGLTKTAAQRMTVAFQERRVAKSYLAVVRGYVEEQAEIDYPLKVVFDKKTDGIKSKNKDPQPAITTYQRLSRIELPFPVGRYETTRYSLISLHPGTGRKHQLRRHMKHIFHPILGDRKYGDWRHNAFLEEQFGCRKLLLHARSLEFEHPFLGEPVKLEAALDASFRRIVEELGFK